MKQRFLNLLLKAQSKKILQAQKSPALAQAQAFRNLQRSLEGTIVADRFGLSAAKDWKDFIHSGSKQVYKDFEGYVDDTLRNDEMPSLFNDEIRFIGLSSGTTMANSKRILFNKAQINLFESFQFQLGSILNQHTDVKVLQQPRITWGSSAVVETLSSGVPAGYVSGFLSARTPSIIRKMSYPSPKVAVMDDMTLKAQALAKEIKGQSIKLISGVPTYVIQLLEELKLVWNVEDFSQVWPELNTMVYSATGIEPYRERLNALIGRPLHFVGCYVSTESPLGFEIPSLNGNQNGIYSFFLHGPLYSFKKADSEKLLAIDELKVGDEVEVLISTPNGLLNYSMGDCIRIKSVEPTITFEIIGRIGQGLNIATEKVSLSELQSAMVSASQSGNASIAHYFVHPGEGLSGKPCYEWTLLLNGFEGVDLQRVCKVLDEKLMALNPDYDEARNKHGFLDNPIVHFRDASLAKNYFKAESHRGQLKMKTAFNSKEDFQNFVSRYQTSKEMLVCKSA